MSDERNIARRHRFGSGPSHRSSMADSIFDVAVILAGCIAWVLTLKALLS